MRRYEVGEKYELPIVGFGKEFVYLDCGGKVEGVLKIEEVMAEDGSLLVREGEKIEVFFVGSESGLRVFTTLKDLHSTIDLKRLRTSHELGLPVEGEVVKEVKGGFEVKVGRVRCFCPFSHMPKTEGKGEELLGRAMSFKILSIDPSGRNILVSRRLFLEDERERKKEEIFSTLRPGEAVEAEVKSFVPGGVIMEVSGFRAFLPRREISWEYVERPEEYLKQGEKIQAIVKEVDPQSERIVLTLKDPNRDPLRNFERAHEPGSLVYGRIKRIESFGILLEFEEGLTAFLPKEKLGLKLKVSDLGGIFKPGENLKVRITGFDFDRRRIEIELAEEDPIKGLLLPQPGEILETKVLKIAEKGLIVETEGGLIGYVPQSELLKKIDRSKSKVYEPGSTLKLMVLKVDPQEGRLILSERRVEEKEQENEYVEYKKSIEEKLDSFSTLKEILERSLKQS